MVFNDFTFQTVYYTNDETFSRFIVQIIQIKGRFVIYKDEWVGKMKIISFIYFPEARLKGTIFFVARSVFLVKLPGCTGQIFGYFAKKICRQFPERSAPDVVYFQILSRLTKLQRRRRPASGQDKFLSGAKSDRCVHAMI